MGDLLSFYQYGAGGEWSDSQTLSEGVEKYLKENYLEQRGTFITFKLQKAKLPQLTIF